jgi:ABC-type uncharacterized transport system substrate-binding protein
LLHDLVSKASVIGFLVNPGDPNADADLQQAQAAAGAFGQKLIVGKASAESEIDAAIANFVEQKVAGFVVDTEPFLADKREKIVALAARTRCPLSTNCGRSPPLGGWPAMARALPMRTGSLASILPQGSPARSL